MEDTFIIMKKLALAVVLGLLIGLEREIQSKRQLKYLFGGIRTFPIIALFGSLSAYIAKEFQSPLIIAVAFVVIAALIGIVYSYDVYRKGHIGITSELSALAIFFIGVILVFFPDIIGILAAILILILLTFKESMHRFSAHIHDKELYAVIKFMIITFVVLPILPDRAVDPWGLFNPYKTWLYAVVVSAISFAGYLAIKVIGPKKGIYTTGFIGGIYSSTSTSLVFAKLARENPVMALEYRNGSLLSYVGSIVKLVFLIAILNRDFVLTVLPALVAVVAIGLVWCAILIYRGKPVRKMPKALEMRNPFKLSYAVEFALFLSFILALSKVLPQYVGDSGIYLTSLIAGLGKIDAIGISMAEEVGLGLSSDLAVKAVILAVFISGLSKSVYATVFGGLQYAKKLAPYMLMSGLGGVIVAAVQFVV